MPTAAQRLLERMPEVRKRMTVIISGHMIPRIWQRLFQMAKKVPRNAARTDKAGSQKDHPRTDDQAAFLLKLALGSVFQVLALFHRSLDELLARRWMDETEHLPTA